jgi:hypothetical protein
MLTALLPVPKFVHKNKRMRGVLGDRLIHQCLDIVLDPVKKAAQFGVMLPDTKGNLRYCFTPLAGYIVDTPEAAMLACVGGKTSPITMAMFKQFGDPFRYEPRTAATTLAQLSVVKSKVAPADLQAFFREAQRFRLNGVSDPFWRNFMCEDPLCRFTMGITIKNTDMRIWHHSHALLSVLEATVSTSLQYDVWLCYVVAFSPDCDCLGN